MVVAVAIRMPGFTTLPELAIPFVFHAVTNLAGLELLARAKKRTVEVKAAEPGQPLSA